MEKLVMFDDQYKNLKVLVTGHTGFKGSWLVLWLQLMGARVLGIGLPPETTPSHWEILELGVESDLIDIRDPILVQKSIRAFSPDIVFHLAAQPLVRRSYHDPLQTWSTNVMGTAHVLEACTQISNLRAIVVVTTDKCYENKEWVWGYRETDPLGGYDPYSASKAGTELVASSYRLSFFNRKGSPLLASARAGNVIGGGDWSEDRLIPDLVRAIQLGKSLEIRSPMSTRPWQHVLDCLSGYLLLGQKLLQGNAECADAWNFGPEREGNRNVKQVLETLKADWAQVNWHCSDKKQLHEAQLLHLDSGKAREKLAWRPVFSFEEGLLSTGLWYRDWLQYGKVDSISHLNNYLNRATQRGLSWSRKELV